MTTNPTTDSVPARAGRSGSQPLAPVDFDGLVSLAMQVTGVPVAVLSLDRGERVVFKSKAHFSAREIPRAEIFCAHVRAARRFLTVPDALADPHFARNPLVTMEQPLRFFAGAAVEDGRGGIRGVLSVLDYVPRELKPGERNALEELAAQVAARLELERLAHETAEHAAELRRMSESVEQQVMERTAALQVANKELEAFAHSVAHDLRAPLRAIENLPGLLIEKFADALPEDACRYLRLLCQSARRMDRLVEDLLTFSRSSLQPMRKQAVSMDSLISALVDESRRQHQGRKLVFRLNPFPDCEADPALLRHVLVNLITNAIKFTAPREVGVVEIGAREIEGRTAYYVRDNGVGFDMRYADRLFDPFHRLHRAEDFEGTGIGLSIVRRIIQRHGGSIWAESEPGKGATFYFFLGKLDGMLRDTGREAPVVVTERAPESPERIHRAAIAV